MTPIIIPRIDILQYYYILLLINYFILRSGNAEFHFTLILSDPCGDNDGMYGRL